MVKEGVSRRKNIQSNLLLTRLWKAYFGIFERYSLVQVLRNSYDFLWKGIQVIMLLDIHFAGFILFNIPLV